MSFSLSFERPKRLADSTNAQIAVLFGTLLAICAIPVLTHPLPPIEDYINHLARMHVIAAINHDPDLARFYQIDWVIVPNLVMDILVPPLTHLMSIYQAGQLFTIMIFVLIMTGMLALNRALFGVWSALPLIAFPLLYNYVFMVGVLNYQFGIGVALWALAAWVALRDQLWLQRLAVSTLFVIALFFCHLYTVGIYGIGLLAFETWRFVTRPQVALRSRIIDYVLTGVPFLPAGLLLMMSPTWSQVGQFDWQSGGKLAGLVDFVELYSGVVAFVICASLGAAAIWAWRQGLLRVHPLAWFVLLCGLPIYFALPRLLFASYMGDERLPIALAFMLVACIHVDLHRRVLLRGFLALCAVTLTMRVIEVDVAWDDLSRETLALRDSARSIARGSRVLIAYADPSGGDHIRDLGLVHAPCLAIIERSALVTTAFTVEGKQVMHVRPPYRDQVDTEDGEAPTVEKLVLAALRENADDKDYWRDWPERFDYVYVLFTDQNWSNPAPDLLEPVRKSARFQLFHVKKPAPSQQG